MNATTKNNCGYNADMPMTCNINSRGRLVRLIYGVILIAGGTLLCMLWAQQSGSVLRWIISIGCVGGGVFAVFEARVGWCAMRAMGFKTRM